MPINRGDSRGEELFLTLHHSSPACRLAIFSDSYKQIGLTLLGMLHLATQEFERLAYANLGTQIAYQHRKSFVKNLENIRTDEPFARFIIFRNTEATLQHRFKIIYLEERKIALLDTIHLGIGKPVRRLLMAKLIHNLCIELVINDG